MNDPQGAAPSAVALEHMTGPARGSLTWLGASTLDVTLDAGCFIDISEPRVGDKNSDLVARFHKIENTYEIEAAVDRSVWVNGIQVVSARLEHGDTIEFGETGPLCRCRFFTEHSPVRNSVSDILSDAVAYLRVSRKPFVRRTINAYQILFGRITHETSILFKVTVLVAIAGFGALIFQQQQLNRHFQDSIETASAKLDNVATAMFNTQKEALRPSDLAALRETLEQRVTLNMTRLEELESRSAATGRIIDESRGAVAFLQGVYGFRERSGDRMLRQLIDSDGLPMISPRGQPLLSADGNGPLVEIQFTGTGFVVGNNSLLITNRHVALPWEKNVSTSLLATDDFVPVMMDFFAYLPNEVKAIQVYLSSASERADIAILGSESALPMVQGLDLFALPPKSGDEIIVIGYPTGLKSMLAQSGSSFIEELQETKNTDFWSVAARLAEEGYIAPLASRGIISQVTQSTIVYDAETTYGGSGGPVLNIEGKVVAVNAAILPEYGGSNFGVPIAEVLELIDQAQNR
ncbi:hypothetical protein A9Q96_14010 [Rhodobacterales bacterium 52_120_T64]|nr:hypothetical protein A9Q96_14010 [Rhodobacterales bacterium 52_120_T64]